MNNFSDISIQAPASSRFDISSDEIANDYAQALTPLISNAFDEIDDALFNLASNARNNNEQNRCFEAMREIRLKRTAVAQTIQNTVINAFSQTKALTNHKAEDDSAHDILSIVDDQVLEEQLAIDTMCSKAEKLLQAEMLTLSPRIQALYSSDHHILNNPLAPNALFRAIHTACSSLEIELTDLLLLYKQFDKAIILELPKLLTEINDKLKSKGVLSDLSAQKARSQGVTSELNTRASDTELKHVELAGFGHPKPTHSNSHASQYSAQCSEASYQDVVNALNLLAHDGIDGFPTHALNHKQLVSDLKQVLIERFDGDKALSESNLDLINLVGLLFEYILDDRNLDPRMQAMIGRLQIPVLKVVLNTPNFFNSPSHPARRFLDRLATAAIGWSDTPNKHNQRYFRELRLLVDRVIEEIDANPSVFNDCDLALESFLSIENKRRAVISQRTKRTEEGKIKSRLAQEFVDNTINDLTAASSAPLPSEVLSLLNGPWRRVLFLSFLKDSEEHRWESTRKVAEELIWCANHHQHEQERQRWVTTVPRLLKLISNELKNISFNPEEAKQLTEALRSSLAKLFRESSLSNTSTLSRPRNTMQATLTPSRAPTSNKQADRETDASNKASSLKISQLEADQWIELEEQGTKRRYKISAVQAELGSFLLIDRLGTNTVEKTAQELEESLCHNQLTILDKGSLVDRALSQMMNNLHRK